MCQVNTLRGPVACTELGVTLTHEHLFVLDPDLQGNFPRPEWDTDQLVGTAQAGLADLARQGVGTLVDLTIAGLGRSIDLVQRTGQASDVHVVVATGYYTRADLPIYFRVHGPGGWYSNEEPLVEMFMGDIQRGIAGSGVRAGVIKVVTDHAGLTADVRRVLEASAQAQVATGVPIFTHSDAQTRNGLVQQEVLGEAGVDLTRVLIGHCDGTDDLGYLRALMDAGSTIGFDRCGFPRPMSDDQRIEQLLSLCAEGYADRITLSHDYAYYSVNLEPSARHRLWPRWRNTTVVDLILPELRRRGMDEGTVAQLLVENPRRLLAGHHEASTV